MALAGDHVQVLVDGYELTGDVNRLGIADAYDMHDVTAFADAVHAFIPGVRRIAVDHFGYLNTAAAKSHPVLKGISIYGVVSVFLGQNASPAVGDPVYSMQTRQTAYTTLPEIEKYVPFTAQFAAVGFADGWGIALAAPTSFTNTTTGAAQDNGASSSKGAAAFLHVLQASASDTYTIIIEGSSTGAFAGEQTTVMTFTLNGTVLDSERVSNGGTIPRYVRWKATRSGAVGNTVKIAISFVRF
ncbi:MAG: hypothetical protein JNJ61_11615 [Anaerolineae bacterium]|nr:hypothetical protein [Anaerolineae bacterium]